MASKKYVEIDGSQRDAPRTASLVSAARSSGPIEVSVYLKARDDDPLLSMAPVTAAEAAARRKSAVLRSRQDVAAERAESHAADIDKIIAFANAAGLTVVKTDPGRRLVKLAGSIEKMEAAFRTKLHDYHDGEVAFRARAGSLSVPEDIADVVDAVLGLDTRPQAKPRLVRHAATKAVTGHLPNEVAKLYDFPPTPGMGKGQCIGIVELGGGYRDSDTALAFKAMGLTPPKVTAVSVSGGTNQPGPDPNSDGEVALDIQVAAGAAPAAAVAVYFAPNTTQGFADAITKAVHDAQNRPSVISISWGSAESNWTGQGLRVMAAALRDAAHLGVTVFAASGDNLATDGEQDGRAHVDFPASSPYVVGCGGTVIDVTGGKITQEKVWNSQGSGTGGGVSDVYPVPGYQKQAPVPKPPQGRKAHRGVPDIAGDADPSSGYRVVVGGMSGVIGGTSAVAPLWAGLVALLNEACGQPLGFIHPVLYGTASALRDITDGDNKAGSIGFNAGPGWDACTGLGVPKGKDLLQLFKTATGPGAPKAAAE